LHHGLFTKAALREKCGLPHELLFTLCLLEVTLTGAHVVGQPVVILFPKKIHLGVIPKAQETENLTIVLEKKFSKVSARGGALCATGSLYEPRDGAAFHSVEGIRVVLGKILLLSLRPCIFFNGLVFTLRLPQVFKKFLLKKKGGINDRDVSEEVEKRAVLNENTLTARLTHPRKLITGIYAEGSGKNLYDAPNTKRVWSDLCYLHALKESPGDHPVVAHHWLHNLHTVIL